MVRQIFKERLEEELTRRGYVFRRESEQEISLGASIDDVFNERPNTKNQGESASWNLCKETTHQRLSGYGPKTNVIKSKIGNLELTYISFDDGSEGISIGRKEEDIVSIDLEAFTSIQRWIDLLGSEDRPYASGLTYLNRALQKPSIKPEEVIKEILDFAENHAHL